MKYLTLIFVALSTFLSISAVNAQSNFKAGYIVNLKGDTTRGFIDYREWDNNPRFISFKTTDKAATQQLSTENITAFNITGLEGYIRYIGLVSRNTLETHELTNAKDTTARRDSIFLELITTGKYLTLFKYADDLKDRYFISEEGKTPVELKYYRYFDSKNSNILTEYTYRQQLQRIVALHYPGNLALIQKVQATQYELKDLEKVTVAINGLTGTQKNNYSSRSEIEFFVGVAGNISTFSYRNYSLRSSTSVLPQLNAGVNIFLNKNVKKSLLRIELNFTGSKADAYAQRLNGEVSYGQQSTFDQYSASLVPQFLYNIYNTEKSRVFFGGGIAFSYSSYSNGTFIAFGARQSEPDFSSTNLSAVLKAGWAVKKFELFAGYGRPIGDLLKSSVVRNSYQLGVNYCFK